jgi:hypothetical protein
MDCCWNCFFKLAKKQLHGWRPLRISSTISFACALPFNPYTWYHCCSLLEPVQDLNTPFWELNAANTLRNTVLMLCRSGEVFKADGEIVASFGGPSSSRSSSSSLPAYSLVTGQPVPLLTPTAANNPPATGHQHVGNTAAAAAGSRSGAEQVKRLKQQLAAVQQKALSAGRDLEASRLAQLQHEHQLAAAEGKVQSLQQQQQQTLRGRAHASSAELVQQQQLQAALQLQEAAAGELTAAEDAVRKVQQQLETLQQQLAAAGGGGDTAGSKSRTAAARRGQKGTVGRGPSAAAAAAEELQEAQQAAAEAAAAAVEEAWREVHKSEQQQKRAASRAAAISKEVGKVQALMEATDTEQIQVRCKTQSTHSRV